LKAYSPDRLRNVAVVGHAGVGKTSLVERLLLEGGVITRMGRVENGSTVSDWTEEEVKRHISIQTSVAPVEWGGAKINLLDTPGYFDFVGEVKSALRVAEAALCVVCAASGVEVGTEHVWEYAAERDLPRIVFINKMDRENANFDQTMAQLRDTFGHPGLVPIHLPMGNAADFRGIIDLIRMQAFVTGKEEPEPIPSQWEAQAQEWREQLVEAVAATDDELIAKYLEGEALSAEEIEGALHKGARQGDIVPVLVGSALNGAGARALLDGLVRLVPSPEEAGPVTANGAGGEEVALQPREGEPAAALVWKTIVDPYVGRLSLFRVYSGTVSSDSTLYNMAKGEEERLGQLFVIRGKEQVPVPRLGPGEIGAVAKLQRTGTGDTLTAPARKVRLEGPVFPEPTLRLAVRPRNKGDEEKISAGLTRLAEEDPTLVFEKDPQTGEFLIAGTGETHLDVMSSRLQGKFGVQVDLVPPKIPYRETIRGRAKVEGKHKKQTGGRGQYGHVWLELEPLPLGQGFEFVDKIFGGAVPRNFIPAVEKGVRETMAEGVLAGYPVVDVRVTLFDGSYHSVDSSEMAFKIAASMAFKKGFMEAQPVLLEPVLNVEVRVPEAYMGDVIGDLNKKRGKILGMEPEGKVQVVRAQVPMAEMTRYAVDLRSMTQGRGSFTTSFSHYEELPPHLAEEVIAQSKEQAS